MVSLMLGAVVNRADCDAESDNDTMHHFNLNTSNATSMGFDAERCKVETIISVSFLVGLIQASCLLSCYLKLLS